MMDIPRKVSHNFLNENIYLKNQLIAINKKKKTLRKQMIHFPEGFLITAIEMN